MFAVASAQDRYNNQAAFSADVCPFSEVGDNHADLRIKKNKHPPRDYLEVVASNPAYTTSYNHLN